MKKHSRDRALELTDEFFVENHRLDLESGLYADNGVHDQKFFRKRDLDILFKKAGLKLEVTKKVEYPWHYAKKYPGYNWEFVDNLDRIWDWFCIVKK